jgi:hypothetical protein
MDYKLNYKKIIYFEMSLDQQKKYPRHFKYLTDNPVALGYIDLNNKINYFTPNNIYSFTELITEYNNHKEMIVKRQLMKEKSKFINEDLIKQEPKKE